MHRVRCAQRTILAAACILSWCAAASAQFDSFLKLPGTESGGNPTVNVTLTPATAKPGDEVTLSIAVKLPPGSSTYSQDPSFQKPTVITLSDSSGLDPLGDGFTAQPPPQRKFDSQFNKELEKFFGDVTWSRKFRMRTDAAPDSVYVRGRLDYLVCDETCRPLKHDFALSLTGASVPEPGQTTPATAISAAPREIVYTQTVTPTSKFDGPEPITLTFALTPENAQPGDEVTLTIDMEIDDGWHSFSLVKASDRQVGNPTLIAIDPAEDPRKPKKIAANPVALHNLSPLGELEESPEPKLYKGTDNAHFGRVTWTGRLKVTGENGYGIKGAIEYSICDKNTCKRPKTIPFELGLVPTQAIQSAVAQVAPDTLAPAAAGSVETVEISRFELVEAAQPNSLAVNLLFAFLGGLILNVMPCVLPVIAIKVLSFVQQSGESRGRIMALNVAYTFGVVLVFLLLATLAVVLKQGWGGLFQNQQFNLLMAAFVFAMGLSLLGVFEIPVPGMVGSSAGGAHREGLVGAFATGIFATLLATPCTGPFMGTTLAWSVKQSAGVVFLIWGVMGLGMASPYLVIGAFPKLVKWLPKPGMWMVRFKEFAGFVLMGAVVWLISSLHGDLLIPALIMLVGIALGLWMIGNLYNPASPPKHKWSVRAAAALLTALVVGFGWNMQYRSTHVAWEPFSTQRIEELRSEGQPILIDFTADWCINCKTNEALALDRPQTAQFLKKHGVVAILADYTDESPEIAQWLAMARHDGVPLTLIFPKGQPDQAIPLRGLYTQDQLLDTLKRAVRGDTTGNIAASAGNAPTTVATPAGASIAK